MSKHSHASALEIEIGELNLVPYMDIMVNLIMFMLVSMTSFIEMKIINVSVPSIQEASSAPPPTTERQLPVAVAIVSEKGFIVSVDGIPLEGTPVGDVTIPMMPDPKSATGGKKFNLDELTKKLVVVKGKQPSVTTVTIVPDKRVKYETLVSVMDAIRWDSSTAASEKRSILYPDVLLGVE